MIIRYIKGYTDIHLNDDKQNYPFIILKLLVKEYLEATNPVGEYLSDQLILAMLISKGGRFMCSVLSDHLKTNILMRPLLMLL